MAADNPNPARKQTEAADKWDAASKSDSLSSHKPNRSDPQLGSLGGLPDELIVEICKCMTPPEVSDVVAKVNDSGSDKTRSNMLHFMQASSRLYGIAHELKCFKERTYNFAVSALGASFEGRMECPPEIIKAAMEHIERVKVIVEIDLDQLGDLAYLDTFVVACWEVKRSMQNTNAKAKTLDRFDIEIRVIDSDFAFGKPFRRPATLPNGDPNFREADTVTVAELLKTSFRLLLQIQNIRGGNVQLMWQPLTYHPGLNCSLPPVTPVMAMDARNRWQRIQMLVDAAACLLSGCEEKELKRCAELLGMPEFKGYHTRMESMSKPAA
jgi:hypothetical protein